MNRMVAMAGVLVLAGGCSSGATRPAGSPGPSEPAVIETTTPPPAPQAAWPYRAWDRAEAIYFNDVAYGPGIPLRVYDEAHGWSPHIVERKPIDRELADLALAWNARLGGEMEVSKCPFPRHAVVLYAQNDPVGTINVCFSCGDILVWPPVESAAAQRPFEERIPDYEEIFARWRGFFTDLGFPLEPPPRAGAD